MNRTDFDRLVAETVRATADLLVAKGAEYAGDGDRLANFKRNAIRNGQTVLETWMTYWNKHIDSIHTYMARAKDGATTLALREIVGDVDQWCRKNPGQLFPDKLISGDALRRKVNDKLPEAMDILDATLSEPIEGRFHDNINYSYLCLALLKELRQGNATPATRIEDSTK
jgi:hypothetical protein